MCDCVVIVLAGGQSTHMGATNKLLLEIDGQSLLQYTVTTYLGLNAKTFSVVVGYEAKSSRCLLRPPNAQIIVNPHHRIEHMTAVLASLQQAPAARSYLVRRSNMPALAVQHLDHLPAAHLASDQKQITISMRVNQRGNPIFIPHVCLDDILANPGHLSCRGFTSKNPNRIRVFDTGNLTFFQDIDTPEESSRWPKLVILSETVRLC